MDYKTTIQTNAGILEYYEHDWKPYRKRITMTNTQTGLIELIHKRRKHKQIRFHQNCDIECPLVR